MSLIDADTGEVVDVDPSTLTFDRSIFPRKKVDTDLTAGHAWDVQGHA